MLILAVTLNLNILHYRLAIVCLLISTKFRKPKISSSLFLSSRFCHVIDISREDFNDIIYKKYYQQRIYNRHSSSYRSEFPFDYIE